MHYNLGRYAHTVKAVLKRRAIMPISGPKNDKPDHTLEHPKTENKKVHSTSQGLVARKKDSYIDHLNMSDDKISQRLNGPIPPRTLSPSEKENRLEQFKPQIRADLKKREREKERLLIEEMTFKAESNDPKAQVWLGQKYESQQNLDLAIKYYNMAGSHQNLEAKKALTQIYTTHSKELSLDSLAEGIAFSLEGQHQEIVTKLLGELEERGKAGDPGSQQVFDAFIQIIMNEPTKS